MASASAVTDAASALDHPSSNHVEAAVRIANASACTPSVASTTSGAAMHASTTAPAIASAAGSCQGRRRISEPGPGPQRWLDALHRLGHAWVVHRKGAQLTDR